MDFVDHNKIGAGRQEYPAPRPYLLSTLYSDEAGLLFESEDIDVVRY
jgi:hypothetical protein